MFRPNLAAAPLFAALALAGAIAFAPPPATESRAVAAEPSVFRSAAAKSAQAAHLAAIAKADAEHQAAVQAAAKEYAAALQVAQDEATKAADLDEALAIRDERERVVSDAASTTSDVRIFEAVWGERISRQEVARRLKKTPRGWAIPTGGIEKHKMHPNSQPGLMVHYAIDGKRQAFFITSPADVLARP